MRSRPRSLQQPYRQPVSRETVMELLILRNDTFGRSRASIADLWRELRRSPTTVNSAAPRPSAQRVDLRFSTCDDLAQADLADHP